MPTLHIEIIYGDTARIGPGKVRLLELIREKGSITEAAQAMGMSYRRAWLLLDDVNKMFDGPLVEKRIGGHARGGASLTPLGEDIIRQYREFEKVSGERLESDFPGLAEDR